VNSSGGRRDLPIEAPSADGLYGREAELARINDLVDRLGEGGGGSLVVRGMAGIGKSSLLAAVVRRATARGFEVLSAAGVQSEARLPFSGLHQLLQPILHLADRLPARQRDALLAAFGMSPESAPELFLIALATLELISTKGEGAPVLLVIEDAQWVDHATSAVLAIVARRLEAEPAMMLIALRDGQESPFDDAGLPDLELEGLDGTAAAALLHTAAPELGPPLRTRVLQEAAGNPLALVELPAAFGAEGPGDGQVVPPRLRLTARLERAFALQESQLPATTRTLVLVAAADDGSSLKQLLHATSIIEGTAVTVDVVGPAIAARLVQMDGLGLRFRHPLVRSAIYQAASVPQRQAAHTALSEVLQGEPDRRVWHRAAAALGPDEQVAEELDEAASRAARRGALAVAIAAQARAAELSESPPRHRDRLLAAAEMAFELGRLQLGLRLLGSAESLDLAPEERTRVSWMRETYDESRWSGASKIAACAETAERMRLDGHPDLALRFLVTVAMRCWWGNPDQHARQAVVTVAERIPVGADDPALLAVLAHADPVGQASVVIERISRLTPAVGGPLEAYLVGAAASAVWAYDLALGFLDAAVDGLRAQGRVGLLVQALASQAWAAVHLAREPLAVSAAEEAFRLARETGQLRWAALAQLAQATISAERGDFDHAEALTRDAEGVLLGLGATPMLALGQFVRGRGAVAHQHYTEGLEHHRRTLDPADPVYQPFVGVWGLSDLVEAAAHSGNQGTAEAYIQQLDSLATSTSGSMLRATLGYARPMVADDDAAEALYQAALERDLANWPCYRGRMLLWYGRWLRRQRRVADSRAPLRAARDGFDALAFPALAETARQELRASGETSRHRVPAAWDQLTPQELQIARMAAEGLSNRQIGEQLYISYKTVGYHLNRMFPKLGITSRSQLHAAVTPVG
jgi:DNA-binding CsgD family transcriptional regulator